MRKGKVNTMELTEKAAYIKGLAEGLALDETSAEARLIKELLALCSDMAEQISEMQEDMDDLGSYIEEIDEDLGDIEEILFDNDDDDEDECDGNCDSCFADCDDGEDYYEIVCPSCGETVCFDESVNAESLVCPACGSPLGCIIDDDDKNPSES